MTVEYGLDMLGPGDNATLLGAGGARCAMELLERHRTVAALMADKADEVASAVRPFPRRFAR